MKKENFTHNIVSLINDTGLSNVDFAKKLGVSSNNISKWTKGTGYPSIAVLIRIALLVNISIDSLFQDEYQGIPNSINGGNRDIRKKNVLISLPAEAGHISDWTPPPNLVSHTEEDEIRYSPSITAPVSGDSMAPTILHGDLVIADRVEKVEDIEQGRIYLINSHSGVHLKYVYRYQEGLNLVPENPNYEAEIIPYSEVRDIWVVKKRITEDLKPPNIIEIITAIEKKKKKD